MGPGGADLIDINDGPFKTALDHTKYAVRYPELDPAQERSKAASYLEDWDGRIATSGFLTGPKPKLADIAIFPFVRQFANTDRAWFDAQNWPHLQAWLAHFIDGADFAAIMHKFPPWGPEDPPQPFPA